MEKEEGLILKFTSLVRNTQKEIVNKKAKIMFVTTYNRHLCQRLLVKKYSFVKQNC